MYIKIFFDNKPLFLCDDIDAELQTYLQHDDTVFIDELSLQAIKSMIHEMQQPLVHAGIYFNKNLDELKKSFFKKFKMILAAGGFVQNEKGQVLMMFRRGKWDLPKGKQDENESPEECAIRETEEETGLKNIKLTTPLPTTYHTYHEGSHFILKETRWFKMKVSGKQNLVPQTNEDISLLVWVSKKELNQYQGKTFPSVQDVLDAGFAKSS
jgi:ADP-ribose pyrophosphatase YjhB (NUDIX family)